MTFTVLHRYTTDQKRLMDRLGNGDRIVDDPRSPKWRYSWESDGSRVATRTVNALVVAGILRKEGSLVVVVDRR